jgi:membrane-bound inhibitor of C-type lysozyme
MNNQRTVFTTPVVILTLVLIFVLAGCYPPQATPATGSETGTTPAATIEATFVCPDGTSIDTVFDNAADTVTVTLPDGTVTLPRVESGSGARYSDGTTTFWNKGDEATIEVGDETVYEGCTTQ